MKDRRLLKLLVLAGASVLSGSACVAENVALGRPYALSHPPNYPYCTDDGDATDLTDGARYNPRGTSLWTQKGTVGWALGEQLKTIEIDLGQICSVEGVTFETAADNRSQGTFPLAVLVFVSDDGQSYSFAGNIINEAVSQAAYVVHTFKLDGLKEQGRFVRLANAGKRIERASRTTNSAECCGRLSPRRRRWGMQRRQSARPLGSHYKSGRGKCSSIVMTSALPIRRIRNCYVMWLC
ncbi:MAG: hypothetical protein H8E66_21195 [Planctomycetes bacterium]|nr:hypothetical protein [Planctomycetota bacterium]